MNRHMVDLPVVGLMVSYTAQQAGNMVTIAVFTRGFQLASCCVGLSSRGGFESGLKSMQPEAS